MKLIILTLVLILAFCANDNVIQLGKSGDALKAEMQDEDNVEKIYIIMFTKVDTDDKALTASNTNQKEGVLAKVNELDQLEDEQKVNFQNVEVADENSKLMKKWHIKESAANKRPVFLVAKGGQGKTFSGPLATLKSVDYFNSIKPESDDGDDDQAAGEDAAPADGGDEEPA